MTILDALKYRLAKRGVDSKADDIAEAVKEMADSDIGGVDKPPYTLSVIDMYSVLQKHFDVILDDLGEEAEIEIDDNDDFWGLFKIYNPVVFWFCTSSTDFFCVSSVFTTENEYHAIDLTSSAVNPNGYNLTLYLRIVEKDNHKVHIEYKLISNYD